MFSENNVHRSVREITEHTKSRVAEILTKSCAKGELKITAEDLPKVLALVTLALDQGYQEATPAFEKQFNRFVEELKKKA